MIQANLRDVEFVRILRLARAHIHQMQVLAWNAPGDRVGDFARTQLKALEAETGADPEDIKLRIDKFTPLLIDVMSPFGTVAGLRVNFPPVLRELK